MKKNAKAAAVRVILPEAAKATADESAQQGVVIWPVQPRLLLTQASVAETGELVASVQAVQSTAQSSADVNPQQPVTLSMAAVAVTAANAAPVVLDEEVSVQAGVLVTGSPADLLVNDTDPEGDVLTIIRYGQPAHGTFSQNPDGSISYIANAGYAGPDELTYTVSDGQGNETVGTLRLTITPAALNRAPVVQDEYLTLQAGVLATGFPSDLLANDSDADGDALRIVRYGQPSHGTFTQNPDGSISYISEPGYAGPEVITYTVSDGQGNETTGALRLTIVGAPNTAPTAVNDTTTVAQDGSVTIAVLSNDTDPDKDTLSVSAVASAANGTATLNADGRITYAPKAGFTGTDSFSYTVSDGKGGSSTAQVSVTVQASAPDMLATADTGASNSDNITSNTRPGFTIPAPPVGSVAVLLVDGVEVAATYNATAKTLTPNAAIAEGEHQISYGYKPSAGGALTLTSGALSISIDAIKEAPGQIDLAAASDSGSSATDNITNVTKPVFNVGALPKAGDVAELYVNNIKVAATYDAAAGTLIPAVALLPGTHAISWTLTNAAGVVSAKAPTLSLVVDTSVPTPLAPDLQSSSDTGTSTTDNITARNQPTFTVATLAAGEVLTVLVDGQPWAATVNDTRNAVTLDKPLSDGDHQISLRLTDVAGNVSLASAALKVSIRTMAPEVSRAPDLQAASDTGASSSDDLTATTQPVFSIPLPPVGATAALYVDGLKVSATYSSGTLKPTVALSEGPHLISYTLTDTATGAESALSPVLPVRIGLGQTLAGGAGDDTLHVNTSDNELAVSISLGGAATSVTTTTSMDQVWSGQGGNDWVDAGDGNDWVDVGAMADRVHPGTGQAASTTELSATVLMSSDDWRLTNSTGSLVANALGTSAADARSVQGWANVADAGWGDDVVKGGEGVDVLYGNAGDDHLAGAAGQDGLRGGVGDDVLVGGQGSDVLRGDDGQDTFRWIAGDAGSAGSPARDVLMDFNAVWSADGGDVLDLRDLLSGEARGSNGAVGNLERYLDIDFSSLPGSTVVHISSSGQFNGSNTAQTEDQTLVLSGQDLRASLGLGLNASDAQVIETLLTQGNLWVGP